MVGRSGHGYTEGDDSGPGSRGMLWRERIIDIDDCLYFSVMAFLELDDRHFRMIARDIDE